MVPSASRRRGFAAGWLLAALVLPWGGQAYGQRATLVVAPFTQGDNVPPGAGASFAEQVSRELEGSDRVGLVSAPAAKAAPVREDGPTGEARFAEGKRLLEDLKFDAAVRALKAGLDEALARPENARFEQVIEAYVSLAVAHFRMGNEEKAQEALLAVTRLAPSHALGGRYPPVFVREFSKAQQEAQKAPKRSLTIEGPAGALAYVDGRKLGPVPQTVGGLVAGTHYVKVEAEGQRFGQRVELVSGAARVQARFAPNEGARSGAGPAVLGTLDAALLAQTGAFAKEAGADFALVGMVYRSAEHQLTAATAVYSANARGFAVLAPVTFDRELLTSQVEAFKLADAVLAKVGSFGAAVKLPSVLVSGLPKVASSRAANDAADEEVYIESGPARIVFTPSAERTRRPVAPAPPVVAKTEERPAPRPMLPPAALSTSTASPEPAVVTSGRAGRWYWWVIGGVALAAAAGGTAYGVTQLNKPVTGTVSASWQ